MTKQKYTKKIFNKTNEILKNKIFFNKTNIIGNIEMNSISFQTPFKYLLYYFFKNFLDFLLTNKYFTLHFATCPKK